MRPGGNVVDRSREIEIAHSRSLQRWSMTRSSEKGHSLGCNDSHANRIRQHGARSRAPVRPDHLQRRKRRAVVGPDGPSHVISILGVRHLTEGVMKSNGVRERWTFAVLHHFQDVPPMVLDVCNWDQSRAAIVQIPSSRLRQERSNRHAGSRCVTSAATFHEPQPEDSRGRRRRVMAQSTAARRPC